MTSEADSPRVDVVMATYNGARYLPEMLDSLAAQDWPALRLIVCDDGSSDGTVELLERFDRVPVRLVRNPVNLGARDNFAQALTLSDAPYVALADQDDVWLPGKIREMVGEMQRIEADGAATLPALVYSDITIVDGDLKILLPSMFEGTFKSREARTVADFSIGNHVPGCAAIVNRPLLDLALPIPARTYMHDWWLCLLAAATGRIGHVERPLILFRRHGSNATGSNLEKQRAGWIGNVARRLKRPGSYIRERHNGSIRLATETRERLAIVEERCGERLTMESRRLIQRLTSRLWLRRFAALRAAHSGDSLVTELLVSLHMGGVGGGLASRKGQS